MDLPRIIIESCSWSPREINHCSINPSERVEQFKKNARELTAQLNYKNFSESQSLYVNYPTLCCPTPSPVIKDFATLFSMASAADECAVYKFVIIENMEF